MLFLSCSTMRSVLLSILFVSTVASAQVTGRYPFAVTPSVASDIYEVEDNFNTYNDGALNGQGNWVTVDGTITIATLGGSKAFHGSTALTDGCAYYNDASFDDNHGVEVTFKGDNDWISAGPSVRVSAGGTYYCMGKEESQSYLRKVVAGEGAFIDYGSDWDDGDVITLEATGTNPTYLTVKINGVADANIGVAGVYTDNASPITTGNPGAHTYGNGTGSYGDNWKGYNLE